jgi:hypothetical protein
VDPERDGLTPADVEQFIEEGFVGVRAAVPPEVVEAGQAVLWRDLDTSPESGATWSEPVRRLLPSDPRPFAAAFKRPRLRTCFDQVVGAGRWMGRPDVGVFVVRFPHARQPDDTGWHLDASFPPADASQPGGPGADYSRWRVNVASRHRALLILFLYSDVGPDDAPTRIRVGSHLDVPSILAPAGDAGMTAVDASLLAAKVAGRPTALATGAAGDVYLCHPFLLHAAQPVRGTRPRLMSQPPLVPRHPLRLERSDGDYSAVETAIRRGLHAAHGRDGPRRSGGRWVD